MCHLLIAILLVDLALAQVGTPFYANKNPEPGVLDNIHISPYSGPKGNGPDQCPGTSSSHGHFGWWPVNHHASEPKADESKKNEINDVDARGILEPIMSPFVTMFDVMQQNAKAHAYADKVVKERESSPFSRSKGLFDLLEKLQQPTTTPTAPPSFMEQMFQPYLEPWQRQLDTISKEMAGITILPPTTTQPPSTTTQRSLLERSLGMFFPSFTPEAPPTTTPAPKEIRRFPAKLFDPEVLEKFFDAFNPSKTHHRTKRFLDSQKDVPIDRETRAKRQSPNIPEFNLIKIPDFFSPNGLKELFDKPIVTNPPSDVTPAPTANSYHPFTTPAHPLQDAPNFLPTIEEFFGNKKQEQQKQSKTEAAGTPPNNRALPELTIPTESPNLMDFFNPLKPNPLLRELNKPVQFGNPFTANPLMAIFTTKKPLPALELSTLAPVPTIQQNHYEPQFKLQDPFYNPLFPNRKSKIFDLLSGGGTSSDLGKK